MSPADADLLRTLAIVALVIYLLPTLVTVVAVALRRVRPHRILVVFALNVFSVLWPVSWFALLGSAIGGTLG